MGVIYSVWSSFLLFIGRICFSLIFILAGYNKITTFQETVTSMANMGIPYTDVALFIAIVLELGGGLLVLFGLFTRFGAFMLFLFIIPVTFFFHDFWTMQGEEMTGNVYHFMKNLAMLGATLFLMASGSGKISLDALFRRNS